MANHATRYMGLEFRGMMSQKKSDKPKLYERVQFMKTIRR